MPSRCLAAGTKVEEPASNRVRSDDGRIDDKLKNHVDTASIQKDDAGKDTDAKELSKDSKRCGNCCTNVEHGEVNKTKLAQTKTVTAIKTCTLGVNGDEIGVSASVSSNSSAKTNSSSMRSNLRVVYYQNRFIAIPLTGTPVVLQPTQADNDSAEKEQTATNRTTYVMLRIIECLQDKDDRPVAPVRTKQVGTVNGLVKFLNTCFIITGIVLFSGVIVTITYTSVSKWL